MLLAGAWGNTGVGDERSLQAARELEIKAEDMNRHKNSIFMTVIEAKVWRTC